MVGELEQTNERMVILALYRPPPTFGSSVKDKDDLLFMFDIFLICSTLFGIVDYFKDPRVRNCICAPIVFHYVLILFAYEGQIINFII